MSWPHGRHHDEAMSSRYSNQAIPKELEAYLGVIFTGDVLYSELDRNKGSDGRGGDVEIRQGQVC